MEHIRLKTDLRAAAETLFGLLLVVLVLTGIVGTLYRLIAPDGWVARLLDGRLTQAGFAALALTAVAFIVWWVCSRTSPRGAQRVTEVAVYGLAGLGLLYSLGYAGLPLP